MSGAQHFNKPNKKHPCIHKKKSHFTWFCCWPSKQHYVWHQGAFSYSGYITHSRQRSRSQLTATDCSISLIPISSTWLFTAGLVLSLWWCLSSGPLYERGSPTHTHSCWTTSLHIHTYKLIHRVSKRGTKMCVQQARENMSVIKNAAKEGNHLEHSKIAFFFFWDSAFSLKWETGWHIFPFFFFFLLPLFQTY